MSQTRASFFQRLLHHVNRPRSRTRKKHTKPHPRETKSGDENAERKKHQAKTDGKNKQRRCTCVERGCKSAGNDEHALARRKSVHSGGGRSGSRERVSVSEDPDQLSMTAMKRNADDKKFSALTKWCHNNSEKKLWLWILCDTDTVGSQKKRAAT